MRLYTIAGVHADTYGAFTITSEALGASPAVHNHPISSVYNLAWNLTRYSAIGHTHAALQSIIADGSDNESVTQQVNFVLSGGVSLTVSGNVLQFDYTPSGTGSEPIGYLKNTNDYGDGAYKIAIGSDTILADYDASADGPAIALIQGI